MTASIPPPPPSAEAPALDVSATPATPFGRLVKVEFRKSVDTRASRWLLITIGILVFLFETVVALAVLLQNQLVAFSDFSSIAGGIASVFLPVFAILLVTSEWSQRTGMVTFALEPRRAVVVLAKATVCVVLTAATIAFGLLVGLGLTGLCELVQPELTMWDSNWQEFIAMFVVQSLTMLVGFGFAALLLNTPAAIVVFFVYWWVLPTVLFIAAELVDWFADIAPWINFQAALEPLAAWTISGEEWGQLLVSGTVWIVLPVAAGVWRILRAEVK